jgi:outer membrane receptor protein involved in Fe transport
VGLPAAARAQGTAGLGGVVTDVTGAPVAGARVTAVVGGGARGTSTGDDGRYAFEAIEPGGVTLRIEAAGFAPEERRVTLREGEVAAADVSLAPSGVAEEVTVTATRSETRLGDTAASVVVLSSAELAATPAFTLDDALRQVPGFSLFRRSGSRTANPTTQGVSLRGVGASGAGRALVLADGIPLNDPFGGWVYWGRVPRVSVERLEVVRGGGSDLYGSSALGGAIQVVTAAPRAPELALEAAYGNEDSADVSLTAGRTFGPWGVRVSAEGFRTEGYVNVDEPERGDVDTPVASERAALDGRLDHVFAGGGRAFLRGALFREARDNGTPLQTNYTRIDQLSAGGDWRWASAGAFAVRAYASRQTYDQSFSAIAADRESESLTRRQRVPAQAVGASLLWSRQVGSAGDLAAGLDAREVRGASDEVGFFGGLPNVASGAGGRERSLGVFARDVVQLHTRWVLIASARMDRWRNMDAFATSRPLPGPGPVTTRIFPDRDETAFSPRASILFRAAERVSLYAAGYRAFRAPTLNELYRAFRVGNVLTLANEQLRAERLTGGEAGARASAFGDRVAVRGAAFWSEITRTVANVTLDVTPELITRQRQNLGRTRSRGLELEADVRLTDRLGLSAGYQFLDATVREFPANRALEGLRIPQVPRHQATAQAVYSVPSGLLVSLQGRALGPQFDDDQNRLPLAGYFTLDALASYPIADGVRAFVAAENVFDREYAIGRTPVETLGQPALVRVGVSVRVGAR